jgi:hypothetical protein
MNINRRVEILEAAALKTNNEAGIKVVFLKKGESSEKGIERSGLQNWSDKIIFVRFVSPSDKPIPHPLGG